MVTTAEINAIKGSIIKVDGQVVQNAVRYILPIHTMRDVASVIYETAAEAQGRSRIATEILGAHPGISRVTLGALLPPDYPHPADYITITRNPRHNGQPVTWPMLDGLILPKIKEAVTAMTKSQKISLVRHEFLSASKTLDDMIAEFTGQGDPEDVAIVKATIQRVNQYLASHGGNANYKGFKNGIVSVSLSGACETCQASALSIQNGLDKFLKMNLRHDYKGLEVLNQAPQAIKLAQQLKRQPV